MPLPARTVASLPCTGNREMSGEVLVGQVGVDVHLPQGIKVYNTLAVVGRSRVVLSFANESEQDVWLNPRT